MGEVQRCEHSRMKNWVRHNCRNAAKVERDGKHYCGTHDPVARKERQAVRDAARRQKWADHMESRPRYTEAQYAALEARVRELEAREEVLQRALSRWLPQIAGDDERGPMYAAASEDSMLLMGLCDETAESEWYGQHVLQRAEQAEAAFSVAQKDAERYRWLRECSNLRSDRTMYVQRNNYEQGKFRGTDFPSGDQLDDVIDEQLAAIAHGGAGEGEKNGQV